MCNIDDDANQQANALRKGNQPNSSDHQGRVFFSNDWGVDLAQLTIRHRRSNDPKKQEEWTFRNVESGATLGPKTITYTTGAGSPFDYWWIKFVLQNGTTYSCKDSFYCSISSSDNGDVDLRIDGSTKKLYVHFNDSSDCDVGIDQVPG